MEKTVDYYMNLPYKIEIYPDYEEGGYTAAIPELPGCLTCSETLAEVCESIIDAKRTWIEAALEEHIPISEPVITERKKIKVS